MTAKNISAILIIALTSLLSACANFFDKDNAPTPTPLTQFTAQVKPHLLFSTKTGSGTNDEFLRLTPAISGNTIYTSNLNGKVAAVDKTNGRLIWLVDTKNSLSAGPGVGDGIVVVGSRRGEIIALNQTDGKIRWQATVHGEVLASPAINQHHVIVKAIDGSVHAFAATDGHVLWSFQQAEPNLILRGASSPRLYEGYAFVGFANGNLVKLGLHNGQPYWVRAVATPEGAFAIQRMIDIDADLVISGHRIFVATYQGRIASLQWSTGDILWTNDISSYTGMTASDDAVFISDANSHLWAFAADRGTVNWQQKQLAARNISGPASMGNYIVVGDAQGYLHWLSKHDGHFVAREFVGSAIYATPLVENGVVYVYTNNGNLVAYTLS